MVKTLLLTPPLSPKQRMGMLSEGGAIMPGLGVLYMAALLRKQGLQVAILDAEGLKLDLKTTTQIIDKENPEILGITATTPSIMLAGAVAKEVKNRIPNIKIFLGGPHVTAMPLETIKKFPEIDGCVLGDGELSFAKIVHNIQNGIEIERGVSGLVWRNNNKILTCPREYPLENLDSLPFPAWDLLKGFPEIYRPSFHSYRRLPVANIITSRGCPYSCSFCDRSVFGRKVNKHSLGYIIEMIENLVKDFGIKEISIKDDTFTLSSNRVIEFCRQLRKRKIGLTWSCNSRIDLVNDEMLREMKSAGCWLISYGIESGSPKMLKKMKKGISKEQIVKALKLTRKNGIVSKGFFMLGIPGETVETMKETLNFIKKLPLDELNINFFTPFPGSELFLEAIQEGFRPDYKRMNMLDTVYIPKGLTEKDLRKYQKQIIFSFYLRPSKIARYLLRALRDLDEFKRIFRMAKMFFALTFSGCKKRLIRQKI